MLTNNVVEAARQAKVRTILYASGSGVYGDLGTAFATCAVPMLPLAPPMFSI